MATHDVGHARRPHLHHRRGDPQPDGVRRLRRGPGGHIGGVSAGLGRYLHLDPNIIRVGFVIASVLAGVGVVAYLAAWLLIPRYDDPTPDVIRLERGPRLVGGAILATIAVVLLTDVGDGHLLGLDRGVGLVFAFGLVGVGAYLLTRTPETVPGGPAFAGAPGHAATGAPPTVAEPIVVEPGDPAEPGSTRGLIPRPSWLTPLTLGAITIVAGIMLALDLADVADPGTTDYAMAGLILCAPRADRVGLRRPRLRADPHRPGVRRGAGRVAVDPLRGGTTASASGATSPSPPASSSRPTASASASSSSTSPACPCSPGPRTSSSTSASARRSSSSRGT